MPELPEVECAVRYLREQLTGSRISKVNVRWKRIIAAPAVDRFPSLLRGLVFRTVSRRGKYIVCEMTDRLGADRFLISHLRMSGRFAVVPNSSRLDKHEHVIIHLSDGRQLRFRDTRKFGRMYLVEDREQVLGKLGLEPLERDFNAAEAYTLITQYKSPIKVVLLRQDIIAGVGNIYADESLWAAGIHPLTPANRLDEPSAKRLFRELRRILSRAIKTKGTDNGDNVIHGGMYSPKAYGRANQNCLRCSALLKRILVAQRGTTYCPRCQKKSYFTQSNRKLS